MLTGFLWKHGSTCNMNRDFKNDTSQESLFFSQNCCYLFYFIVFFDTYISSKLNHQNWIWFACQIFRTIYSKFLPVKFWSSNFLERVSITSWIYFCLPCWNCHLVRKDMGLHLHCLGRVPPLHATHAQCLKKLMAPFSQLNNGFYSTFSLRLDF